MFLAGDASPVNLGIGFVGVSLGFGLGLMLIHLIGIPVTNLSANAARNTAPALLAGGSYISQLWLFWLARIIGAALAGIVYPIMAGRGRDLCVPCRYQESDLTPPPIPPACRLSHRKSMDSLTSLSVAWRHFISVIRHAP